MKKLLASVAPFLLMGAPAYAMTALIAIFFFLVPASVSAMVTPMFNSHGAQPSTTAVNYTQFLDGATAGVSTAPLDTASPIAGTISNMIAYASTSPGVGSSYTYTLMQNDVATALSCTISGVNTQCTDTTHSISVAAGDLLDWQITPSGTPTAPLFNISSTFSGTNSDESLLSGDSSTLVTSGTNYYILSGSNGNATETNMETIMPTSGTVDDFYFRLTTSVVAGKGWTATVVKNGVATAITCTVNGTQLCSDLTDSVSYAAGDTISLQITVISTPSSHSSGWSMRFKPTTDGESIISSTLGTWSNGTKYFAAQGRTASNATEDLAQIPSPIAFTWKKLYVWLSNAPAGTASKIATASVNTVTQSLSAAVTGTNTTANDTSDTVSVNAGDLIDYVGTTVSGPSGATQNSMSAVAYIAPPSGASAPKAMVSIFGGSIKIQGGNLQIK